LDVYVRSFPDMGKPTRVSTGGGRVPRWSPLRRELSTGQTTIKSC
jgi:hypothetical protein